MGSALTTAPLGYCADKVEYRLALSAIVVASTAILYLFLKQNSFSVSQESQSINMASSLNREIL